MDLACLKTLLRTSRPRFWPYVAGPYLLAVTPLLLSSPTTLQRSFVLAWGIWLLFPGNLFLYGINDLHDEATDALNAKKDGYEARVTNATRRTISLGVYGSILLGLFLASLTIVAFPAHRLWIIAGNVGFLLLGGQYSAPPLRLKARPGLDSLSNALYIFPVFLAWGLSQPSTTFPWILFFAGTSWCAAMHAFSAVPDIRADREAGLRTIATELGASGTILLCAALYALAAGLASAWLGAATLVVASMYVGLMLCAWIARHREQDLFLVYRLFPWVNMAVGFGLWVMVAAAS
jgi:4-hydroxybenzoate polyprenyltransferase